MTTMNKRIKRTAVSRWMAMTAAALTLGACSQDETAGGDGALSPMELTATGLESMVTPMTRATVDGNWEGVSEVAVKVGSEVKLYTVTADDADKKTATLKAGEGVVPFYWPASGDVTVSAWPYNEGDITTKPAVAVESDQSGVGYAASDFIEAVDQKVTKGYPTLVFEHRTAKICVTLKAADGTTPLTGAVVSISVGGQTVVEKCYNENNSNEYLALIAPTAAAEELTVKIADTGGKNYVYKHTTAVEYEANSQYTFNLKLKGDEVVALSGCTISGWTDKTLVSDGTAEEVGYTVDAAGAYHVTSAAGLDAWAEAVASSFDKRVSCVLKNDIEMPAVAAGEINWEPISTFFGIFDGNGKTITGLVVNKGTESEAGFIAWNNGTVKNLTLENAKITGGNTVGAVVCDNYGTIENCHVTGESVITGGNGNQVGGVVSYNYNTILACHVAKDCTVSGGSQVGGIAGYNDGQITGCYALCSLTGTDYIGGICGQVNIGLASCYSKCSYNSSGNRIGGIVGENVGLNANFTACYYANCTKGVGFGSDPSGMTKIEGETSWATACGEMNNNLTGYEYYANTTGTSADEPLMLRKKQ